MDLLYVGIGERSEVLSGTGLVKLLLRNRALPIR
jgi:hypothetical protein